MFASLPLHLTVLLEGGEIDGVRVPLVHFNMVVVLVQDARVMGFCPDHFGAGLSEPLVVKLAGTQQILLRS